MPHVDGASAGIVTASGAVRGAAATNLKGVDDCIPIASTKDKHVKKFVTDYNAKLGCGPDLLGGAGLRHGELRG